MGVPEEAVTNLLACITQVTKQLWLAVDRNDTAREAWLMQELECYITQYQREAGCQTKGC